MLNEKHFDINLNFSLLLKMLTTEQISIHLQFSVNHIQFYGTHKEFIWTLSILFTLFVFMQTFEFFNETL